jgi:8-oxo-dGTP diphosphatase
MPETTVAAIITRTEHDRNKILLTRRSHDPYNNFWCLPGGHIDPYESARAAVIREVREETGLEFVAEWFNYFDEIIPDYHIHAIVLVFIGHGLGELRFQADEVSEIGWFTANEAQALTLAFKHAEILAAYAEREMSSTDAASAS